MKKFELNDFGHLYKYRTTGRLGGVNPIYPLILLYIGINYLPSCFISHKEHNTQDSTKINCISNNSNIAVDTLKQYITLAKNP